MGTLLLIALGLDARDRETHLVALSKPGHHAALVHHPPVGRPRTAPPVIVCHGMGVNAMCMDALDDGAGSPRLSLVRAMANAGFDVWALELRGRGKAIVPKRSRWTVDDEVGEDVPRAIEAVLEKTGSDEVWWVGHSKGAMVQLLFGATGHALAKKVTALVAIGTPGTVVFQRKLAPMDFPSAFPHIFSGRWKSDSARIAETPFGDHIEVGPGEPVRDLPHYKLESGESVSRPMPKHVAEKTP